MIRRQDMKRYEGKIVKINLKNNYFFMGEVARLEHDYMVFIDRKVGEMIISLGDIKQIIPEVNGK